MPIRVGAGYYDNPYLSYNLNKRTQNADAQSDDTGYASAASAASMGLDAAQSLRPQDGNALPKTQTVEAGSESQEFRHDSMNRNFSDAQMNMLDLQAAFFGFSSRRPTDIPQTSFEDILRDTKESAIEISDY